MDRGANWNTTVTNNEVMSTWDSEGIDGVTIETSATRLNAGAWTNSETQLTILEEASLEASMAEAESFSS